MQTSVILCFVLFDSKVLTNTQIVQSDSLSFSSSVLFHNLHACALVHFQEFKYILINGKGHFMRTNVPKWKHVTFYLSLTLILSFFKLILKHSHCYRVQEMHG